MSQSCPLVFRSVDGTLARINAFLVTLLLTLFLAIGDPLWLYLLGADFAVRILGWGRISPVEMLARGVKRVLKLGTHKVDAGAKRLAGYFGVLFSLLLLVADYLQMMLATYAVGSVFLLCAALEAFFEYCVGCKIYYLWRKVSGGA